MAENDGERFLRDMHARIAAAIGNALDDHGVGDAGGTAERHAIAVVVGLLAEWQGTQLYLALKKSALLEEAVFAEMSAGSTANEIARKFGIAYSTAYKIYKRELSRRREPKQAKLPGV